MESGRSTRKAETHETTKPKPGNGMMSFLLTFFPNKAHDEVQHQEGKELDYQPYTRVRIRKEGISVGKVINYHIKQVKFFFFFFVFSFLVLGSNPGPHAC
jgi:hypothetical protein